jgi:protein-S-isoprenylcysteine O-methyltransferase Ste14
VKSSSSNSFDEYSPAVYTLLQILLWLLLVVTVALLYLRRSELAAWQIYLYGGLLAVYLVAERRAYQPPASIGRRLHENLRYWLSLTWWLVIIGAPLEYALLPRQNLAVVLVGTVLSILGISLRVWAVHTLGQYYSGHIESWQGQVVVEQGPYHWIRHPGYAGNILQIVGMPLVLNAYFILLLSVVVIGLFVRRMTWEEAALADQLPGYRDYMLRTRRLIPGIW